MNARSARLLTYGVVALLGAAALRLTPTLPERRPAEILLQGEATGDLPTLNASTEPREQRDTLERGESLVALLQRAGLPDSDANAVVLAATRSRAIDARRIPAGMPVVVASDDSAAAPNDVTLQLAIDRFVHLRRTASGWEGSEERLPWTTDTIVVAGTINSTLYQAMDSSADELLPVGARRQLTWTLADIFEYRVDMSRDLQEGDRFRVLVERATAPTGAVRIGRVIAASLGLSGSEVSAVRFESRGASGSYFDKDGKSLRAAFLRAPLEFRRISSVFGRRFHPILGRWKSHKGTDYAASQGTPVRAIGDGVVIKAGWGGGYGNVLEIRHRNGYVTRYGHLRGFARGIRAGVRVNIAQTVAYVGTTGLSTGPHLHFEVLVHGVQRDPRSALSSKSGEPIPAGERSAFQALRDRLIASLDAPPGATKLAALSLTESSP